jgi:predicted RNA-binding Zn-ribbon protein involved in translation (DUF1610 family)
MRTRTTEGVREVCEVCGTELIHDEKYMGFDCYENGEGNWVEEHQHLCHNCSHLNCDYVGEQQ